MKEMQPGSPERRGRHDHLPAGDVHRAVDRQPHAGAADRHPARDPDHHRLPVRVAHGLHQPDRDPAVAARGDPRARPARRDHQRDGARGTGRRDRGGGRRRDHRCGEHRRGACARRAPRAATSRPSGSCSTPRSRCGRAITYATVINIVAIVPVFFLEGLSGAFFQPLVLSYGLAVLVSMLVALTVTPALCLLMLSRGKLRHTRVAAAAGAEARLRRDPHAGHPQAEPGDPDGRRVPAGRAADLPDAREPAAAELQGARLPDALADRAGHLRARRRRASRCAPARTCARSRASATAARTSARR